MFNVRSRAYGTRKSAPASGEITWVVDIGYIKLNGFSACAAFILF